jgi:hypothetical protein
VESAALSSLPPPSARTEEPPSSRAKHLPKHLPPTYPAGDCYDRATPEELKLAAQARYRELHVLTGLSRRECMKAGIPIRGKAYGKSTVQYWLDARAEERCPPPEFVRWLDERLAAALLEVR